MRLCPSRGGEWQERESLERHRKDGHRDRCRCRHVYGVTAQVCSGIVLLKMREKNANRQKQGASR